MQVEFLEISIRKSEIPQIRNICIMIIKIQLMKNLKSKNTPGWFDSSLFLGFVLREVAFAFLFWVRARLVWQEKTFRQYRKVNTGTSQSKRVPPLWFSRIGIAPKPFLRVLLVLSPNILGIPKGSPLSNWSKSRYYFHRGIDSFGTREPKSKPRTQKLIRPP